MKHLIIINACIYIIQSLIGPENNIFLIKTFGLVPKNILQDLWLWQIVTYMFFHGGFFHIFFNMFCLWMFGRHIEDYWGAREFLKYYFLTGIGAAFLTVATSPFSVTPSIGASGAVYGLLVAFAMLYPDTMIYLYFLIPVKAKHLVIIFAVGEFVASFAGVQGIARFAHLGGMLTGFVYLRYGWVIRIKAKSIFKGFRKPKKIKIDVKNRTAFESSEDLTQEVNRILEKILVKGPSSLTEVEEQTMQKYSKK